MGCEVVVCKGEEGRGQRDPQNGFVQVHIEHANMIGRSIRQAAAYGSTRQHTAAHGSTRPHTR